MNIYVGNLSRETTEDDLKETFGAFGQVSSASIIKDKFTGESRGFGFVEMPNSQEAAAAMSGVKQLNGRNLTVNEARPKVEGQRGGGGGGRRGPGGHRGGGGFRKEHY
jgi:RNA recognition motif-containing protein